MGGGWRLDNRHKLFMSIGIIAGVSIGVYFKSSTHSIVGLSLIGAIIGIVSAGPYEGDSPANPATGPTLAK